MGILSFFGGKPSKDEYARTLMTAIRAGGETRDLKYDSAASLITAVGEPLHKLYIDNQCDEYCVTPRAMRPNRIACQVQSWFDSQQEVPEVFAEAAGNLLPRVRETFFWNAAQLRARLDGNKPMNTRMRLVTDHLTATVVYDLPQSMRELGASEYEEWGVTFDYALDQAMRNLENASSGDFVAVAPGVFTVPWDDSYQSSRLLLVERLRALRLSGSPVASVPARNQFFVCGSEDQDGVSILAALTQKSFDGDPRAMSAIPVILDGDAWKPYLPPVGHPAYSLIRLLWMKSEARDYQEQKELLDKLHEKEGIDVYVAKYTAVRRDDGVLRSYCTLTNTVDTLLPLTDMVALIPDVETQAEPIIVSWPDLIDVAGEIVEATDLYPPRFRVRTFPSTAQLDVLSGRATQS